MKKKITIFKLAIKDINNQFIGSSTEKKKFIAKVYIHYVFKTLGLKSPLKFPIANFQYQNAVLQTRYNTIDFWPCLESYEPDLTYFLREVISSDEKVTFIDVGGHIGRFTTLMAKNNHKVITFEPLKSNYEAILGNLERNSCAHNATIFNLGLGDENKSQVIYFNPQEMGEASLVNSQAGNQKDSIEIVKFDGFDHGQKIEDVCVVKIDIEGNEEKAVEGMKNFITSHKPLLVIEIWNDYSKDLIPFLKSIGYKRLHIFWYVGDKHDAYMNEMRSLYQRSKMYFNEQGDLIRN